MTLRKTFLLGAALIAAVSIAPGVDDWPVLTARAERGEAKAQLDLAYRYCDGKLTREELVNPIQ